MARLTELLLNGGRQRIDADSDRTLLSVLRDDLDLTGTKYGCGEGQCAACTVLVDGVATKACLTKVGSVAGKRIVTIEGLASNGKLHPVQQAFLDADALQCGYCTPGMLATAYDMLSRIPDLDRDRIRAELAGNLCRCTGYQPIIRAIEDVHSQRSKLANPSRIAATS